MAFGLPARYETRIPCGGEDPIETMGRVKAAISALGWRLYEEGKGKIVAIAALSLATYGEKVEARLVDDGIHVESRCALPFQVFDWGQNKRNVVRLIRALER